MALHCGLKAVNPREGEVARDQREEGLLALEVLQGIWERDGRNRCSWLSRRLICGEQARGTLGRTWKSFYLIKWSSWAFEWLIARVDPLHKVIYKG